MKRTIVALAVCTVLTAPALAQKGSVSAPEGIGGSSQPGNSSTPDTITTSSGLKYVITRHGTGGQAAPGNVAIVQYTGTFLDGKVFDSSRERNEPFAFTLGQHQVIKGWDEGFALLHVGDRATLVIPPDLAYGDKDRPPIPANSTLVFDVELLDLKEHALADYLAELLSTGGVAAMQKSYSDMKRKGFGNYYVGEAQLNGLGYQLMNAAKLPEALAIFKINVDLFPKSFNVYDSIAEAYMNNGDNKLAIENYRKSLKLNPKNDNAVTMLKKLGVVSGQ